MVFYKNTSKYLFLTLSLVVLILGSRIAATQTEPISNPSSRAVSLSDLSIDAFDNIESAEKIRNPFAPGTTDKAVDPFSLSLEGIIIGPNTRLGLISGKVLQEGDTVGNFLVKTILPGYIEIQSVEGLHTLSIDSYLSTSLNSSNFEIIFQNAGLRDAINMIATAGHFNIIIPENIEGRVSLNFRNTPLKDALASILRTNSLEYAEENNIIRIGDSKAFPEGTNLDTKNLMLNYATASDLVSTVKEHLSGRGTVTADSRTNTLILKDDQSTIQKVTELIRRLDSQDTQVHIEAKIVDVTRTFSRSLGIQWGFTRDTGRVQGFTSTGASSYNVNLPATTPTSGIGILIGNVINDTDLSAELTAAEARGDAHVISQPSVTTLNNTPANIRSGVKFYVKTTSTIAVGGSGSSSSASDDGLEEIDTGIELTVTPQITPDNTIKLKISAEESEADFTRSVDGIPAVIDNTASTTVIVKNGETAVIGGLMKVSKSNAKSSVPFLSSIPVFGWLFQSRTKSKTDNELLIFITPRIVGSNLPLAFESAPPGYDSQVDKEVIQSDDDNKNTSKTFNKYSR